MLFDNYSVVLVSAIQQRKSAISYTYAPLSGASIPTLPIPPLQVQGFILLTECQYPHPSLASANQVHLSSSSPETVH